MYVKEMKLLEWFLWILLFIKSIKSEKIYCSKECNDVEEICKVSPVQGSFWSNTTEKTAPKPQHVNIKIFRKNSEFWLRIVWSQKASQMEFVNAYLIKIISTDSDQPRNLKVDIKRHLLMQNVSDSEVTFEYSCYQLSNPRFGNMYFARIFSLPLYQPNSDDLCGKAQIIFKRRRIKNRRRTTTQQVLHTVTTTAKTTQQLEMTREQTSDLISSHNETASIPWASNMSDGSTSQIIIIGVLSILGTILLLVISTVLYIAVCRGLRLFYKQGKRRTYKGAVAQQLQERKHKVTVVGSTMDRDDFYTDLTLSLANTLNSWEEFQVSCNLWMLKEISRTGIGIWVHNVIKASEKVVIICNPTTFNTIQHKTSSQEKIMSTDIASQVILSTAQFSKCRLKLIIVCADPRKHDCLRNQIPFSQMQESIALPGNFMKLIEVLVSHKKKNLSFKKEVAILQESFTKKISQLQEKYFKAGNLTEHPNNFDLSSKQAGTHEYPDHFDEKVNKLHINVHKMKNEEMQPGFKTISEGHYDSVYSSRCNSNSTDTISSGEDTGFHESEHCYKPENDAVKFELLGARPKITDKTFTS